MTSHPGALVVVRHGESTLNAARRFTGRMDVDLSDAGVEQAHAAAALLQGCDVLPDVLVSSPMLRARRTAEVIRTDLGLADAPLELSWRLVERDYGCLTGMAKHHARELLGPEGFMSLRRTLHGTPPPAAPETVEPSDCYTEPATELSTAGAGESLHDVIARVGPWWAGTVPVLRRGGTVLVVAHGNSLRALCALIDDLDEREVQELNLPPGHPLVYDIASDGRASPRGGRYLDPTSAHRAAEQIAGEGGT
ncbi:phosphoglycerate mutase (plasmid) [Cellulomonas sp. WB94]|uniref:2,3-bisphosphoglycerate-dependent phosphoglycerate mutase n=1 Tax=Cellulomonas sp. WB94 TaxID=2173174 RepID=UPI000D570D7C|nr:2,3-bisphosphoglycerate-dependent phosphoglycerate mutase [Cellulomonas sp. WB94]PVU84288.1 phosphoglycerate mutase [Cellulomonas sp. WB94]